MTQWQANRLFRLQIYLKFTDPERFVYNDSNKPRIFSLGLGAGLRKIMP